MAATTTNLSIVDYQLPNNTHDPSIIIGFDIKWRPNNCFHDNPTATLQLCIGHRCLIFQFIYSSQIPQSLFDFLNNPIYTFVGVGIHTDVDKLTKDYGLFVATTVDLRSLAADCDMIELRNAGLKNLAKEVLGKEIEGFRY
ncbi:Werner Syndrome-like exonuclease [Camellia lanceoleosa]|uniref:Werner Syndrome-like exonuclease n=1 Tax=Camellia lanceoleosa TaxID=1840588 RepID=A0ACC0G485_9ERIC|nr:Werner Syndrome-like exonuclease [Camellia lanceoleosa]